LSIFYKKNGTVVPKPLPAVCDKLSITFDVHPSERKKVAKWVQNELEPTPKYGAYMAAGLLPADDVSLGYGSGHKGGNSVLIQCQPKIGKVNKMRFLRVEANPSRVDLCFALTAMNYCLPNLYERVVNAGVVTSFHLAVDVAHAEIDEMLFYAPGFSVCAMYQKSGRTEYIGARQFRIYDKRAEIREANKKKPESARQKVPDYPLLRIEKMLTPPAKTSLADLPSLPNPMEKLRIAAYSTLPEGSDFWPLFLHAARLGGAQSALATIKCKKRKSEYKSRLEAGWTDWWKPEDVWAQLPEIVDSILNPSGHLAAA
jgi:hypothetical protein